jgi:hypothetical protein
VIPGVKSLFTKLFFRFVFFNSFLRVPILNFGITLIRFISFKLRGKAHFKKKLKVGGDILRYEYSLDAYKKWLIKPLTRSSLVYQLASVLIWPNTFDKKMLIIGPRFESDIFFAMGYGFLRKNIAALDLFSYSRLIELGDGHNLRFEDSTFDIVILPWVLIYSNNQSVFISESKRVLKNNGILICAGDHCSTGPEAGVGVYDYSYTYLDTMFTSDGFDRILNFSNGDINNPESGPIIYATRKRD